LENIVLHTTENEYDNRNHELKDLRSSDGFCYCSGNLHVEGPKEVISVHERMNDEVEVGQVSVESGRRGIRVESNIRVRMWWYQWRKRRGFLRKTLTKVSVNSASLLSTKINIQNPFVPVVIP
ncbi:hypothetical protein PENTCL1PPCAC_4065, partial [Pristionchus entomophagus]